MAGGRSAPKPGARGDVLTGGAPPAMACSPSASTTRQDIPMAHLMGGQPPAIDRTRDGRERRR